MVENKITKIPINNIDYLLKAIKINDNVMQTILRTSSLTQIMANHTNKLTQLHNKITLPMKILEMRFNILSDAIEKGAKEMKRIDSKIRKSNNKWILYQKLPLTILNLYDHQNKKFIDFLDDMKHLDDYTDFLTKNKYIKPYKEILKRGLKAHIEKDFLVSIPLLIIVIDGSFYTYGIKKKIVKRGKIKGTNSNANFKNISKYLQSTYQMLSNEFVEFVDKKTKYRTKRKNQLWTFRNNVLHGINPNYGSEQWSIKLLFVLRFLECTLND